MTKAAELAKMGEVLTNSQIGGRRNIIINGAMQVAQRGTSFTGVGNGDNGYYLDRFEFVESGSPNGEFTITQASDGPDGFANSIKFDCTTAESSLGESERIRFRQQIEGQNLQHLKKGTSSAEKITLSFYVKSNLTGTACVQVYDSDNTRHISKSYTIDSANTWEKKTITFNGDTTGTLDDDNSDSLWIQFMLQAGTNFSSGTLATSWESYTAANSAAGQTINIASSTDNNFFITGVQLEVGEQATPFEHRSYGEELKLCNRYYQEFNYDRHGYYVTNGGAASSSQSKFLYTYYGGEMRATASVSTPSVSNGYRFLGSGNDHSHSTIPNIDNPSRLSVQFGNNQNTITAGNSFRLLLSTSGAKIKFDAEL